MRERKDRGAMEMESRGCASCMTISDPSIEVGLVAFMVSQSLWCIVAILISLSGSSVCAQVYDGNGSGVSDIWEAYYGMDGPSADVDTDSDGVSDWEEGLAGTAPDDPASFFGMQIEAVNESELFVSWMSKKGKRYQLEGLDDEGSWQSRG